jgi:hypothetical protein
MFTWSFWEKALERAIRAFTWGFIGGGTGQVVIPALPVPVELQEPPTLLGLLLLALYTGTAAAVLSVGASMMATRRGDPEDPSFMPPAPGTPPLTPPADTHTSENPRA